MALALSTSFQAVASGDIIRIDTLEIDRGYPVVYARRVNPQYGETVLLTLQMGEGEQNVMVYMPKRYAECFADAHIEEINNSIKLYKLFYRGKQGTAFLLNLEL